MKGKGTFTEEQSQYIIERMYDKIQHGVHAKNAAIDVMEELNAKFPELDVNSKQVALRYAYLKNRGKTPDSPQKKHIEYKGKEYATAEDFCNTYGIEWDAIMYHVVDKGFDFETAVDILLAKKKRLTYKGKSYRSLKALAKDVGIPNTTLYLRVQAGESIESAISSILADREKSSVTYNGKTYKALTFLARDLDLPYHFIYGKMRDGAKIEDAVEHARVKESRRKLIRQAKLGLREGGTNE